VKGGDDRSIGVFARASYSPPNRNLIDHYAYGGRGLIGFQEGRPHDKFSLAVAYAHVGRGRRVSIAISNPCTDGMAARRRFSPPSSSTKGGWPHAAEPAVYPATRRDSEAIRRLVEIGLAAQPK
jgi:Carbohydrate-selective porin, OprB family